MNQYQNARGNRRQTSCPMPCSVPYSVPTNSNSAKILEHADHLPLAMAYVPFQKFTTPYKPCDALKMGTIFPDLCKPFCGKRGCMR